MHFPKVRAPAQAQIFRMIRAPEQEWVNEDLFWFYGGGGPVGMQTARRIVLLLESMGDGVLTHLLVGDNAWPNLPERAYRQVPRKTPRPNVCTAN